MVYRPPFIKQLDGSRYAGLNCTCASMAMLLIRDKKGVNPPGTAPWYPTPSYIRAVTGDKVGGTNLAQMDYVGRAKYGTDLEVQYRMSWDNFVKKIKEGRGAILQGRYAAFRGTKYDASGTFTGNHAVYINEVSTSGNSFLMYDPLADGRRSGIYRGPIIIDNYTLKKFAGGLVTNERTDSRVGFGYCYAGFSRDTEPFSVPVYLASGCVEFGPKNLTISVDRANVRRGPSLSSPVYYTLNKGEDFTAWQRTRGDIWFGNRFGTQFVHNSVVTGD